MALSQSLSKLAPRALGLVFFGAIFGGTLLTTGHLYLTAVRQKEAAIRLHVSDMVQNAAALVDVWRHEQLVRPEQHDGPDYRRALAPLAAFHLRHPEIDYVFTVRMEAEGAPRFVLESIQAPEVRAQQEKLGRHPALVRLLDEYHAPAESRQADAPLRRGEPFVFPVPYHDEYGSYIEGRAPLRDESGRLVGYVGLDYDLTAYQQQVNEVRLAGLFAVGLALLVGALTGRIAADMRRATLADRDRILRAEAEARTQRDQAQKANEAKGEVLRIASHDLKNPLAAIAGMSGLLLKMMKARPDQAAVKDDAEVLDSIHASARHMSEIVRGLLMSEGLEQGGLPFEPVATDLGQLCAKVLRFNAPAAKKKNITVREEIAAGLTATVDARLLHEAFDNYVSNGIKYSPPGRTVTVTLGAGAAGGWEFAVRDEGQGLSAEDQTKLFQKFKKLTPRPTGGESSTGLGLSIVKTVAGLHHGEVGCESEVGRGSRFWLRAPLVPPPA